MNRERFDCSDGSIPSTAMLSHSRRQEDADLGRESGPGRSGRSQGRRPDTRRHPDRVLSRDEGADNFAGILPSTVTWYRSRRVV